MAKLYNLARMSTATRGAGTITLGSAVLSFLSFSGAGVSDGETITYAIEDGSSREIGRGVYTASGTTLTRSVLKSTNSDSPIVLSGDAEVFITAAAEDFFLQVDGIALDDDNVLTGVSRLAVGSAITSPATGADLHVGDSNSGEISSVFITSDKIIASYESTAPGFSFVVTGASSGHRGVFAARRARGTLAAPTAVAANDEVFTLLGSTFDGTALRSTAAISFQAEGTITDNVQAPQRMIFQTGTASRSERARIDSAGNVVVGTAAIATTATDGFLYVPTCAGTPTGVPTSYTGRAPIVINSTNNKLYFYSGGAWRDAGP